MSNRTVPHHATIEQRIAVAFDYPVVFTRAALDPANSALVDAMSRCEPGRRHRFLAVIDDGVARAWPNLAERLAAYAAAHADRLEMAGAPLVVPGGEACKNGSSVVELLQHHLYRAAIDRHSFLLAIGGGALLDAAGYAAATTHRGVRLVRLPTTVLAQNDSAVGVKNGINAFGLKNFLGSFAPPFAVVADFNFLATLEPRDRRAGLAEAVKVAAIRDAAFLAWLEAEAEALAGFLPEPEEVMVRRSAELHLAHIRDGGDPFEMGSARPLDFGHWAAHKLETLTAHALRHGEAVAIGVALDALYSAEVGLLAAAEAARLCRLLRRLGFGLWDAALDLRGDDDSRLVAEGIGEFREHLGGELTLTLLAGPGRGIEVHDVDWPALERAILALRAQEAAA